MAATGWGRWVALAALVTAGALLLLLLRTACAPVHAVPGDQHVHHSPGALRNGSEPNERFARALQQALARPVDTYSYHTPSGRPRERRAYAIVYIDDDRSHLCGVRALIALVRASGSPHDVLALVPPATRPDSRQYLAALGYVVRDVPLIRPNVIRDGYYASVFTSLNLWNLDDYDCIVKLDTDMVLLDNIDELFMYSTFAATLDWPAGKPITWPDCRETELCQHTYHDWRMTHLNGAMFVVHPDKRTYNDMLGVLQRHEEKLEGGPSEQGFLNWYFKNKWFPLPYFYNVRYSAMLHFPQLFVAVPPRVLHYIGAYKPWKEPWNCNWQCRNDPLQSMFNAEWYVYYNMIPFTPDTTPPVACYDSLRG